MSTDDPEKLTDVPCVILTVAETGALIVAVGIWFGVLFALQLAVVPPFAPVHDHVHGPVPVTEVGVPTQQRLVVGADATVVPLDEPHDPLIGAAETTIVRDWQFVDHAHALSCDLK